MKLHDHTTLQDETRPEKFSYEYDYLIPFMEQGTKKYIHNVEAELKLLHAGDVLFPVTINHEEYDNSYVCSPYTMFISYAAEELKKLQRPALERVLHLIIRALGWWLKKAEINKVVCVNNWFLSTNLYPEWQGQEIPEITKEITALYPGHAVAFRSLNEVSNQELLQRFAHQGYDLIGSRQVYIINDKSGAHLTRRDNQNDQRLLASTPYQIIKHDEIQARDYPRITELYNKLYLEKYSQHNPQFSLDFIRLCHEKRLLIMHGLRNTEGVIDGINGYFERNGIVTTPLVGYDTDLPTKLGLYRMLSALVINHCHEHNLTLNFSAGVAHFKSQRGAVPAIEFSAIYTKHLSLRQKLTWKVLKGVINTVGIPLMRRYKL